MRKSIKDVYDAWVWNKTKSVKSPTYAQTGKQEYMLSTDGETIFSYGVPLLLIHRKRLTLNVRRYSRTTLLQQNGLRELLQRDGRLFVERVI